ncbi:MAG: glycosyltransferase family 2 protein [Verrucomicrobiota bacterium]
MPPLVSIIIPSFNQGKFIKATLDSILSQDYRPLEIIVVDGASKDETVTVLHQYDGVPEVKWISEPDKGVVDGVNKGFRRAQGLFAAIQSSDDYYLPGAIATAMKELQNDSQLGFVFGDIVKIDADGRELSRSKLGPYSRENILSLQTWIPQPSCFFRLELARQLGGWREEVPYAPDTELWYRMMLRAGARKIDQPLAVRRMHGEQRDRQGEKIIRSYAQVVQDYFEKFGAPPELRPAAEAGLLLMRNRYGYGENESVKLDRLRQAVEMYPPLAKLLPPASGLFRRAVGKVLRKLRVRQ